MILTIDREGTARCLYTEDLDLAELGVQRIDRASEVEPTEAGWTADLLLAGGPILGPFPTRSQALAAEVAWLENHVL